MCDWLIDVQMYILVMCLNFKMGSEIKKKQKQPKHVDPLGLAMLLGALGTKFAWEMGR